MLRSFRGVAISFALVLAAGTAAPLFAQPATPPATTPSGKIPVKTADDLPRHTYQIEGKASEFLRSDAPFKAFVTKVRADIESDLLKYDITDVATLKDMYNTLQQIAIFEGRDQDAIALIEKSRAIETKEAKKLMTGQVLTSLVEARKSSAGGTDQAKLQAAFGKELAARVGALPCSRGRA